MVSITLVKTTGLASESDHIYIINNKLKCSKLNRINNQNVSFSNNEINIHHEDFVYDSLETIGQITCLLAVRNLILFGDSFGCLHCKNEYLETVWKCKVGLIDFIVPFDEEEQGNEIYGFLCFVGKNAILVQGGIITRQFQLNQICPGACVIKGCKLEPTKECMTAQLEHLLNTKQSEEHLMIKDEEFTPKEQMVIFIQEDILYSFDGFKTRIYFEFDFVLTKVVAFRCNWSEHDYLIIAGHFCGIKIIYNGKMIAEYVTDDWVKDIKVNDMNHSCCVGYSSTKSSNLDDESCQHSIGDEILPNQIALLLDNSQIYIIQMNKSNSTN